MCKFVNASFPRLTTANESVWFCFYTFDLHIGIIHLVCTKSFRKTKISKPLIRTRMCAYQGVKNISVSENVLNGLSQTFLISFVTPRCTVLDNKYLPVEPRLRRSTLRLLFFWRDYMKTRNLKRAAENMSP